MSVAHDSFAPGATSPTAVDRLGRWLSTVRMRRYLGDVDRPPCRRHRAAATTPRSALAPVRPGRVTRCSSTSRSIRRCADRQRTLLCGLLPDVLGDVADASIDAIICNNVLEHLDDPDATAAHLHRILSPGGVCVVNVPSWRGKRFLEFAAFRLGVAPKEEMDDHKAYYDPRDLWPLLVRAGFRPSESRSRGTRAG